MLDAETKARIDSARDILVGKVPDPKSQVEQITIALIYKFMDDMDRQSEELDGKATFFSGEFKKYGWVNLLDKRFSGHERLLLYAEGIEKMNENQNIPQLFRDIFRGVFLPYRDPETLNLFLKEINSFTYDNSERLGDAFEYLLSVMDSQGAAGQFRTPRHIIDFIVAVVDPQKNQTVLDPACGTAGFLISSYKHILRCSEDHGPSSPESDATERVPLTPDERGRLMTNFCGYDISPDMVRLSRVNMYLHGFAQPRIHEYDTLTSEERWDERYDVIMANPPFMTPKGGIRPHNRFSIKAARSEVLFVDYIAEHLNPGGRAGVIVPEGIVFQSQNAYKALRRMLVENYLWCVVSLPAGVFNPYSGVKTSILFLDRNLARRTDEVLFVKVEGDGFDLGAQRRPNGKNDLPQALAAIHQWRENAEGHGLSWPNAETKADATERVPPIAHTVPRRRILESAGCSLSGDRYRDMGARVSGKWPMVKLGEVAEITSGQSPDGQFYNSEGKGLPFYQGKAEFGDTFLRSPSKWTSQTTRTSVRDDILMSVRAPVGPVNINPFQQICIGRGLAAIRPKAAARDWYLFHVLRAQEEVIRRGCGGSTFESINHSQIEDLEIPLPPLAEQERLVAELEGYRKIIEGARQVVTNYKPTIKIDQSWPMVKLGEVCGINPAKLEIAHLNGDLNVSFVPMCELAEGQPRFETTQTRQLRDVLRGYTYFRNGDVLLAKITPCFENGKVAIARNLANGLGFGSTEFIVLRPERERLLPELLYHFISTDAFRRKGKSHMTGSAGQQRVTLFYVENYEIPLPPLDIQRQIVASLEAERALVESNRKLIELFEAKIKARVDELWQ